jgi:DegV family protein with EDD domain
MADYDYIISCCSTADMSAKFFEENDIHFVCFHYTMDGNDYPDDLGKTIPAEDFFARMASGSEPTTSQVNVEEYIEFFTPFLSKGKDILHATLSSGISGSYNSAVIAAEQLGKQFPDRKVTIVDSYAASSGYGLLMTLIADKRKAGASYAEACAFAEDFKLYIHHWFFSSDLTFFYKGGRISRASHIFGTMLNICPLMNVNNEGKLIVRDKNQGIKRSIKQALKRMETFAEDRLAYSGKCYISHSAILDAAQELASAIEERFPKLDGKVVINNIGTVIGSHTGPGTVALFFVGDRRED